MNRSNPTVLVVEDDSAIRQTIVEILEFEGYRVSGARDGLEALEMIERLHPQILVLDLALPLLSGDELLAELERRGIRPGLPVILITADSRAKEKAHQLHIADYLEKPFSLDVLLGTIERLLRVENKP